MSLTPPDFYVSRPIGSGSGQSHPSDVRRLRTALRRTGHGQFPRQGASNVTPGLTEAVRRFQSDFGLEADGVIEPGGPTERAMSMALNTLNTDGDAAFGRLRKSFAERSEAGLTFAPDPKDERSGVWRDSAGREIKQAQVITFPPTISPPPGVPYSPVQRVPNYVGSDQPTLSPSQRRALDNIRNRPFPYLGWKRLRDESEEHSPSNARKNPADEPSSLLFPRELFKYIVPHNLVIPPTPFPTDPPEGVDHREEFPAEEREPTITISPEPEQRLPHLEIFPDHSEISKAWLILRNSRGNEKVQGRISKPYIDELHRLVEEGGYGKYFEHVAGAETVPDTDGKRTYMKERTIYPVPEQKDRLGSVRPDYSALWFGKYYDVNFVDTYVDGVTLTPREAKSLKQAQENKSKYDNEALIWAVSKLKNAPSDVVESYAKKRALETYQDLLNEIPPGFSGRDSN